MRQDAALAAAAASRHNAASCQALSKQLSGIYTLAQQVTPAMRRISRVRCEAARLSLHPALVSLQRPTQLQLSIAG